MAKLIVTTDEQERIVALPDRGPFVIGREESADLALDDRKLSRRHCAFERTAMGRWTVRDLGSRNGTLKNGEKLGDEPEALSDTDVIQIGNVKARLLSGEEVAGASRKAEVETLEVAGGLELEESGAADSEVPDSEFMILVEPPEDEPGRSREIPLSAARLTIGKAQGSDLVLADKRVSGVHAEIVLEDGVYLIRDLGSTNGTRIAGRKVTSQGATLSHGDVVSLGKTRITFKHRDLPLDEEFLFGATRVSSVPSRRGRTPWGVLAFAVILLGAMGGGVWYFLETKRAPAEEVVQAPGDSLLTENFSFEDTAGGSVPDDYIRVQGEGTASVTTAAAHQGTRALVLRPEGELVVGPRKVISVRGGERLRVSLMAMANEGASLATQLRTYSATSSEDEAAVTGDFSHVVGGAASRPTKGSFQQITTTLLVPSGATAATLELVARGEGQVLVDDVVLSRASVASQGDVAAERIEGQFMGLVVDARGVFLVDRLGSPLVQNGELRIETEATVLGVADLSPTVTAPVRDGSTCEWRGSFQDGEEGTGSRMSARITPEGVVTEFEVSQPEGASAATLEVVFETTLERVAGRLGVMGGSQSQKVSGDFDEQDVFQVIFGIDDRVNASVLSIDPPAHVRFARIDGRPTFTIRAAGTELLTLRWDANFSTDAGRLRTLLAEGQELERRSLFGPAAESYRRVIQEFPFNEVEKARAEARLESLLGRGEQRLADLRDQFESTHRLGHRNFKEAARRDLLRFEAEFKGTSMTSEAEEMRAELEEEMASEDAALRESQAARLYQSGEDFAGEGYASVGRAKLEHTVDTFGRSPDDPGFDWATKAKETLGKLGLTTGGEEE